MDGVLAPVLIPTILASNLVRLLKDEQLELLYTTVSLSTILATGTSIVQYRLNRTTSSRNKLTAFTALLMTFSSVTSTIIINMIRMLFQPNDYKLPDSAPDKQTDDPFQLFVYHFRADIIPGLLIFTQAILNTLIIHELTSRAKRTFTIGESFIISQLMTMSYLTWALVKYSNLTGAGPFQVSIETDIVLNIGMIVFTIVFIPVYFFRLFRFKLMKYMLLAVSMGLSYSVSSSLIGSISDLEPLTWLVDYIFTTHQRISLFSVWLSTVTACVSFSISWSRMVGQTNSLVRKIFHLAICCVFITGYSQDIVFTRFAAGGVVVILFLLEVVRAWRLEPVGNRLEDVCKSLRGKWDNKYVTVSHIYLLVGTFLPLWLIPSSTSSVNKLSLSAGLIAVGVGDTAAAIVGSFLGSTKMNAKSDKTVEGLLGNAAAMLIFKQIWIGYSDFIGEFSFLLAVAFTALIESLITTCDNLILPLVMLLFMEVF